MNCKFIIVANDFAQINILTLYIRTQGTYVHTQPMTACEVVPCIYTQHVWYYYTAMHFT